MSFLTQPPQYLYKLVTQSQWKSMKQLGINYKQGSDLDQQDGYLHISTAKQIERISNKYFGDLENGKMIKLDYKKIENILKWEPNSKGEYFPHCYGQIPLSAVIDVYDFSIHSFNFKNLEY
ncbi:MAG TPA: DUF952 domain-containing protein [Gammaproteobacteria bacterium]|nr:DUF952 domain-containing protein [Gammaproteobacteria bacterium]